MSTIIEESKVQAFIKGLTKTALPIAAEQLVLAEKALATLDFPTTRIEDWKYTRVTKITNKTFHSEESKIDCLPVLPLKDEVINIVFINGFYSPEWSTVDFPAGLSIQIGKEINSSVLGTFASTERSVFSAMNLLYATDAVHVQIEDKAVIETPIQVVHIAKGTQVISNSKVLITAGAFSKAHVTQVYLSEDASECFTNVTTEVAVGANAYLKIDKLQNEKEDNFALHQDHVKQAKDSNFTINTITLNGGLVRNNLNIDVEGQNVETHLNGAFVLKGNQHVDNHTCVDHLVSNCESNELYKGVMDESSTAVFNGKVFVRKDAQKINAYQSNGNVLLSDNASVNTKPELEIYADDVKCSHGTTTGQLDEEAIYYLRARGISEKSAKALMVTAFIGDVIEKIENEELINYVHACLHERFGWDF